MASQERLSVDAAAQRLGITSDAVRSRIKRGTLWAVRRNGRVRVVLRDTLTREAAPREVAGREVVAREVGSARLAGHEAATSGPTHGPTHGPDTLGAQAPANDEAVTRLRVEIARQKHRVRELVRERERLSGELGRQQKFLDLEYALRARLQDQLDRLNERLSRC